MEKETAMAAFDVLVIPTPFGGAWACHINTRGAEALEYFFSEPAWPLEPLGDRRGHIVEPQQCADLAEYMSAEGLRWTSER
jgi:hypothetical protein